MLSNIRLYMNENVHVAYRLVSKVAEASRNMSFLIVFLSSNLSVAKRQLNA